MSTTTEHLKALLVDDGREFAMVRKADLAALMRVANAYPDGKFFNLVGELQRKVMSRDSIVQTLQSRNQAIMIDAFKHGEERRRYMANNKALLARNAVLEDDMDTYHAMYKEDGIKLDLLRLAIRKAPATCRMLGLIE